MKRCAIVLAAMVVATAPAFGQQVLREAISPMLSPEAAAAAFDDAVVNGCIASVAKGARIAAGGFAGKVSANLNADTRKEIGATDDETVFDVVAGKGVVIVKEKDGRCAVSVYGPPASATVMALARRLAAPEQGFERLMTAPSPNGLGESLFKFADGKRMQVTIRGSEPGMPGHKSRFSVVTATVFATPAG